MDQGTQTPTQYIVISRRRQYEILFTMLAIMVVTFWLLTGASGLLFKFAV